ncbi:LMBR1 domain-containing protein 1 [Trypanosoma theileri]|uniref:LMBR1 domain-containing protein 1 n=1 Tax=Trypanosoma theileri TaxID=67003 RepID=A0A1X0NM00_9TRYP|nr:LMBR1 domain-containing protein 1 [Trypanosoma theileri]ORC85736.1 LMBR1 domain-containing protein 1 [Trypanosoma theileri]
MVVGFLLCVALGIYILFYFKSEEDDGTAYLEKVVVVIGMIMSVAVVLLLPFDAANATDPTVENKYHNTLNTVLMWQIVLWMAAIMAVVVVPFVLFYYEAYDPDKNKPGKQIIQGVLYTLGVFGIFAILCGACYATIGVAQVPLQTYEAYPQLNVNVESVLYNGSSIASRAQIGVSFFTYCVGILCFFGWIAFFFYGGVGLVSFPIDLISGFIKRPKAISASRFAQEMAVIAAKGDALLEMALEMQKATRGTISRSMQNKINILRNETYILEAQQDQLIWAYTKAGGSPFIVYGRLVLGIISVGFSVAWVLHIFLYNQFDQSPFLNTILTKLDGVFALFGIIAYAVLTFYLMWITFEGQVRLGMRLVFFQIHPLKPHDTTMNSLLFNVSISLLTSFAVVEFVSRSFREYSPRTSINALMNVYVLRLKFFGDVIWWAQFCLLGVSLLSLVWVILCPVHRRHKDLTKIRINS